MDDTGKIFAERTLSLPKRRNDEMTNKFAERMKGLILRKDDRAKRKGFSSSRSQRATLRREARRLRFGVPTG
jgi:hypothetical protein